MRKYEITFNENFEAIMPTPIVLNQSDSNFKIDFHIPKKNIEDASVTTAYLQCTLAREDKSIKVKVPEGMNASIEVDSINPNKYAMVSVEVPSKVTQYYGRVKCALIFKRELTEEEKVILEEQEFDEELLDEENLTDVETISSAIFYLFVRETTNYDRTIPEEEEDVVLVEIQKLIDAAQAKINQVKSNIYKFDNPFSSYHDFATSSINQFKLNGLNEIYLGNVTINKTSNHVIGLVSWSAFFNSYQTIIVSSEGRVIVSDGENEKYLTNLKISSPFIYAATLTGQSKVEEGSSFFVPTPVLDGEAAPKSYVDKMARDTDTSLPFVGTIAPNPEQKKIWFDTGESLKESLDENIMDETNNVINDFTQEESLINYSLDSKELVKNEGFLIEENGEKLLQSEEILVENTGDTQTEVLVEYNQEENLIYEEKLIITEEN